MWNDEKFRALSAPKPNAQSLWQRLLTGPELGCVPGLFAAREGGLADALRWPLAAFRRCWKEIAVAEMARADWPAGLVWVPNAIVHNEPTAPNTVIGWRTAIRELPECRLKHDALGELRTYLEGMGPPWVKAFDEACAKASAIPSPKLNGMGSRIQETDQEQEQEPTREPARARRPDVFGDSFVTPADELPDTWAPNAEHAALAQRFGLNLDDEVGEFRAYCRKQRRVSAAWDAEFELWIRRSKKFERGRQRGGGRGPGRGPVQVDKSGLTGWEEPNGTG